MKKEEIYETIKEFLELIWEGKGSVEENEQALTFLLDKLAMAYYYSEYESDAIHYEYPDPPEPDYSLIRKIVSERFPRLGNYNLPKYLLWEDSDIELADSIDDIVRIASDLWEIEWRWRNNSEFDALWYFRFRYLAHWGCYLRCLQFYLFLRFYEVKW